MTKMEIYHVYLDDGQNVYKVTVPAESQKKAVEYTQGNGEAVAVKKEEWPIHLGKLADDLRRMAWGQTEIDIITRTLSQVLKDTTD